MSEGGAAGSPFERLFHTDLVGMALLNRQTGRIDDCNEKLAAFFGRCRGDFLGRHVSAFEPFFPSRDHYQQLLVTWASGATLHNVPIHSAMPDGRRRDGLVTVQSLPDGVGGLIDVAMIVDVTDQRRLEAQLRQAQRLESVGRLAAGVAHEFNNLLAIISGFVDMLGAITTSNRHVALALDEMRAACTRGEHLTSSLLAFSRQRPLDAEVVDVHTAIGEAMTAIRAMFRIRTQIEVKLGATARQVRIDRNEFEKILLEIARNARDGMTGGGTFTIETSDAGAEIRIALTDTGAGMDAVTLERSFEPFFTTKHVGQGPGLGLAVVYGVVQQSGGRVQASSRPGHGTTVEIYLPALAPAAAQLPKDTEATPLVTGHEKVLVLDPDRSMAMLIEPFLAHLGYDIVRVTRDDEGTMDELPADVVVLVGAVGAPRREVSQALRKLRRARPGCPVVVISERPAGPRVVLRDLSIAHVGLPFALANLAVTLRRLLDR